MNIHSFFFELVTTLDTGNHVMNFFSKTGVNKMSLKKILIVDDSSADLANLKSSLGDLGVQIISATSGEEAVKKCKSDIPDLVLMDIVMGDFDGYKACREITHDEATKDIPVVFVTSKNNRADRLWAEKQGARGLVTKPYTKENILEQVNRYR
jgi:twitching motility two-component system response regulator PilH